MKTGDPEIILKKSEKGDMAMSQDILELYHGKLIRGVSTKKPCLLSNQVIPNGQRRLDLGSQGSVIEEVAVQRVRQWLLDERIMTRSEVMSLSSIQDIRKVLPQKILEGCLTPNQEVFAKKNILILGGKEVLAYIEENK